MQRFCLRAFSLSRTRAASTKPQMVVDRPLPADPRIAARRNHLATFVVATLFTSVASLGIFNYEKISSPSISAALYFLRRSPKAEAVLGRNVRFAGAPFTAGIVPWVSGTVNTAHGIIDCSTELEGESGRARMVLKAEKRHGRFEILEWVLEDAGGNVLADLTQDSAVDLVL